MQIKQLKLLCFQKSKQTSQPRQLPEPETAIQAFDIIVNSSLL